MGYVHYERLSALDSSFLDLEDPNVHMHVASVGIFEGGPLLLPDGGLEIERIRAFVGPALGRSQRFRQRLETVPGLGRRVWVDDPRFNLDYHLRHTALPEPGDVRLLKRLAARILSQKLDRGKPLWEIWFVEGLEGNRFAVITKVHHCMIDGISGVDLLAALMRFEPGGEPDEGAGATWLPRPAPGPIRLLADELRHRAALPGRALRAARAALQRPGAALESASGTLGSVREAVFRGLGTASPTPLNESIGPYRRFDWTCFDLDSVKEVKDKLGGTLNDVVLAVVAGTLRGFLQQRGLRPEALDFRALLPVSVRRDSERGKLGNRVAYMIAPLPVGEADPRRRLERVTATTTRLKRSGQARGGEIVELLGDWTAAGLLPFLMRLATRQRSYNLVVTNVPGPRQAAYLLGARMLEVYPLVPLFSNQALGIALFSYDGRLHWGFNADWDAVPDLHDVVELLQLEFEALRKV
jgi:WS/DGAT/MGAT family acyltransferase